MVKTESMMRFIAIGAAISVVDGLSKNISMLVILGTALFTGNVLNKIIIYKIYTRENYKGIPATILPFVCVIAVYFMAGYR